MISSKRSSSQEAVLFLVALICRYTELSRCSNWAEKNIAIENRVAGIIKIFRNTTGVFACPGSSFWQRTLEVTQYVEQHQGQGSVLVSGLQHRGLAMVIWDECRSAGVWDRVELCVGY